MSGRKKRHNPLDFLWTAAPFQAVWALGQDDVPKWDTARGFPESLPQAPIKILGPTDDLLELRELLGDKTWEPNPPPEGRYPRLVRANYTEPLYVRSCEHIVVLNELMRLLRKSPPDKWIMKAICKLNAEVGPVRRGGHTDNTLESWLNLARIVQAHMRARSILDLMGYSHMRENVEKWGNDWGEKYGKHEYNPYRVGILSHTFDSADKHMFRFKILEAARERIHKLRVVTDRDTLEKKFVAESTLYTWVLYRIGDIWESAAEVAECQGCQNLFLSRRKGKLYCDNACRNRNHENRKRRLSTTA